MLYRVFLLVMMAVSTAVVSQPTTQQPKVELGPALRFDKVNVSCFPLQVVCNAPSGCMLRDGGGVPGKRAFCNVTDETFSYFGPGPGVTIQIEAVPFRTFYANAMGEGGLFPLSIPADAKGCGLTVARSGKTTTVSLACEFDKAVDYSIGADGEILKAVSEEGQSKQDGAAGDVTTANPVGQQQQQQQQQQEQKQQKQ